MCYTKIKCNLEAIMANKFSKAPRNLTQRELLERKYNQARYNILGLVLFTLLNVILALTGSDTYYLFTATVPFVLVSLSMLFCGLYPPEYYEGDLAGMNVLPYEVFIVATVIAFVIVALYVLAFFCSRKGRVGWLIFALVLFGIDTLFLFGYFGIAIDMILDYVFHAWVIVILVMGIKNHYSLKALPDEPEEELCTENSSEISEENGVGETSSPLRIADMSVKSRILLQAEAGGKQIIYRRVKKTNELVIGGYVYDEYVALMELPHTLTAVIDGHTVEAGMMQSSQSFIAVDGEIIAKKLRLF